MISGRSLCRLIWAACRACSGVPPCAMIRPRTRATQRPAYGETGVFSLSATKDFSLAMLGRWNIFFQIHNTNKREITIILVEVKTESKNEFVGNIEAAIMDGDNRFASFGFIQQGTYFQTAWLTQVQHFKYGRNRVTAINNVFHKKYIF